MRKAVLLSFGLVIATLVVAPPAASDGTAFGVSPAEVRIQDPPALRGQQYVGVFKLSNRQDAPTTVTVAPEGNIASWLAVTPNSPFIIEPKTTRDVVVKVNVPNDAGNGDYTGRLRVRAAAPNAEGGSSSSAVAVELVPLVRVRVAGDQVVAFAYESLAVKNATAGRPLEIGAGIVNTGNVRANPQMHVRVTDGERRVVLDEVLDVGFREPRSGGEIALRTTSKLASAEAHVVETVLKLGTDTFGRKEAPFTAAPLGSAGKALPEGRLLAFGPDGAAVANQPVKLMATFKNTGVDAIESARLSLEVFKDGVRVAAPASDALRIAPGVEESLEAFWTPNAPGDYTVRGSITYDGLRATVSETPVKVSGQSVSDSTKRETPPPAPPQDEGKPGGLRIPGPSVLVAIGGLALVGLAARRR